MKTILIIMIMLAGMTISAQKTQNNYYLATLIIEKCDAVITNQMESDDGSCYNIFTEVSSFYDFDLLKMHVKSVCSEFSDVSTLVNWTISEKGSYYKKLQAGGEKLLILFSPEDKTIAFSCQYK